MQIEQHRFVEIGGQTRHHGGDVMQGDVEGVDKTWTSHAVFVDAQDPEQMRQRLAARSFRYVDLLPSQSPGGVWMLGGRYWLEQALAALKREPI